MAFPASSNSGVRSFRDAFLTDAERSILLTVLYADLFDFALTHEELHQRLVLRRSDPASIRQRVESLVGPYLAESGDYVTWKGREYLADVRRRRRVASRDLWDAAERYAGWLSCIPFVRMVAVSGSLAVDNAEKRSDIDLFCITESNRLWTARLFIVPLSKMTRFLKRVFPCYLCPNYLLTLDTLEIQDRSLFTAHEVVQAAPLWGSDVHRRFLQANAWVEAFLPHRPIKSAALDDPPRPLMTRIFERAFRGRLGDRIDALIFNAFRSFYRRRASRLGGSWTTLERAYRRDSYTVPEGGYVPVVSRLFARRLGDRTGMTSNDHDIRRLFPSGAPPADNSFYRWDELFRQDYGGASAGSPPIDPT